MSKGFFLLTNLLKIKVWGQDSERYLNNRLSNNVKELVNINSCQQAAALSAQGKTEALLTLCKIEKDHYNLFADSHDHDSTIKSIFRYKVADKFNYEKMGEEFTAAHFFDSALGSDIEKTRAFLGQIKQKLNTKIIAYSCFRTTDSGLDLIARCSARNLTKTLKELGYPEVAGMESKLLRYKAKVPAFPDEINDKYLLQEANLRNSYSTKKGCYVGQEVTQKVDSFAKLPYRLVFVNASINSDSEIAPALALYSNSDRSIKAGELVSYQKDLDQNAYFGFARIKNQEYAEQQLYSDKLCFELSEIFDFSLGTRECFTLE